MTRYKVVLEHSGFEVHDYREFGSYQGDWWAYVTLDGVTGWVHGYFGSCGGCDSLLATLGYDSHIHDGGEYISSSFLSEFMNYEGDCKICKQYKDRVLRFGEDYLDAVISQEEAEKKAKENIDWDMDAVEVYEFVKSKRMCC